MTVIKLVKTPKSAFNPQRPAGRLLLSQIEHLEHAVGRVSKGAKRTEGQAARYIAELTSELLRRAQEPTAPAPPPLAGAAPAAASTAPAIPAAMPATKTTATRHHASPVRKAAGRKASKPAPARRARKKKKAPGRRRSR